MNTHSYFIINGHSGGWWLSLLHTALRKFDPEAQIEERHGSLEEPLMNPRMVILDTVSAGNLSETIEELHRK